VGTVDVLCWLRVISKPILFGINDNRAAATQSYGALERITLVEGVLFPTYAFGR
jgi:hypothetical protein